MKLWKCAAIALILCGAALSLLRTRMAPARTGHLLTRDSSSRSPSASPTASNASVSLGIEHRRKRRSSEGANSVLSEFMDIFQSFTEGELKQVIGALVERKARRDASESKRTKRARKGARCSLQDQEVTVSQLELGYESDEIVLFRYCSGKCSASRRNYDITLASMKERLRGRREKVRHNPCCRPTSYEDDFAFLDNHNKYQTIKEWSASKCGCV